MDSNAKIILGILAVVVVVLGVIAWQGGEATGETVKIGIIVPLSGDAAAYGQEIQKIVSHRLAEINSQRGAKIEVVWEDGKCSGGEVVNAFQKLTDLDGIRIIIGGVCSSETLAIAPLTRDGRALAVSGWSSNPNIEGASPYTFTLSYSDQAVGETLAREMSGYGRVAIITEQNDYNVGIKNVWEREIANYPNVQIVANEIFPKGGTDFRNLLARVQRANPEAVLLNPNVGITADNLLKQLAEMSNWTGYRIYAPFSYLADNTREGVGGFAEGMVIVDSPDLTSPDFLAYKAEIERTQGPIPTLGNYYTASAVDTLDILASLIRELGDDPRAVRDALAERTFRGYLGEIYFGGMSFKQGSQGGVYVVSEGKAVYRQ